MSNTKDASDRKDKPKRKHSASSLARRNAPQSSGSSRTKKGPKQAKDNPSSDFMGTKDDENAPSNSGALNDGDNSTSVSKEHLNQARDFKKPKGSSGDATKANKGVRSS